jgi:hypothetical protein
MHLAGLWRYPVKSLAGEQLESVTLTPDGVEGDRIVHVSNGRRPLTGRTRHRLLTLPATTGPGGIPRVDGHPWDSPAALAAVRARAGPDARLIAYHGPERFDIANLLLATDGAVAAFGHDIRRLRPNLLIAGVPAQAEATWPGHALAIGHALIGIHSPRPRCVVTSIDPDTGEHQPEVFRHIRRDFNGKLALNCWVIRPGVITAGDVARLIPTNAQPPALGGWITGAPYRPSPRPYRQPLPSPTDTQTRHRPIPAPWGAPRTGVGGQAWGRFKELQGARMWNGRVAHSPRKAGTGMASDNDTITAADGDMDITDVTVADAAMEPWVRQLN